MSKPDISTFTPSRLRIFGLSFGWNFLTLSLANILIELLQPLLRRTAFSLESFLSREGAIFFVCVALGIFVIARNQAVWKIVVTDTYIEGPTAWGSRLRLPLARLDIEKTRQTSRFYLFFTRRQIWSLDEQYIHLEEYAFKKTQVSAILKTIYESGGTSR